MSFNQDPEEELSAPEPRPFYPARAAIILAAGEGSRFEGKTHKLLTPFKGKPLVSWSVEAAQKAGFEDIYVVMGSVDLSEVMPESVTLIQNESWENGQGCSLNVAISCVRRDWHKSVVVGLADTPLIPASAWETVANTEGAVVTAIYSSSGKKALRSPPVKLEDFTWESLPLGGDEGARLLMKKRPELVVEIECEGNPADIDTLQDLKDLEKARE